MENPLSKVALDHWYQVLMVAGLAVFLANGAGLLKAYPAGPVGLVSLGCFFFGMGEWMNHPRRTELHPATLHRPAFKVTRFPRNPGAAGVAVDALGIALIVYGVYRLFVVSP